MVRSVRHQIHADAWSRDSPRRGAKLRQVEPGEGCILAVRMASHAGTAYGLRGRAAGPSDTELLVLNSHDAHGVSGIPT